MSFTYSFLTLQDLYQHKEPINFTVISDTRLTMARDGHEEAVGKEKRSKHQSNVYPMRIHEPVEKSTQSIGFSG